MHGIVKDVDKGVVGFTQEYGGTWHRLPEYKQIDGPVLLAEARQTLDYEVVKVPLAFNLSTSPDLLAKLPQIDGKIVEMATSGIDEEHDGGRMFALVRTDKGNPVFWQSVSGEYEIFQNVEFLNTIDSLLLSKYPQLAIESVGSLWGGRIAFVNIILDRFTVKNDASPSVARLMYYNAFGGRSISACCHNTRIVCNNTMMMAEAQGAANETLRKFKHTKGAAKRVGDHLIDISKVNEHVAEHKLALDRLAGIDMNSRDVEAFLGNLFPVAKEAGKATVTRRLNNRQEILKIFETAEDLQGAIKATRFAMLQATTNYSQHSTLSKSTDASASFFNVATGGNRHELNQSAFDLLIQNDIPEPPQSVLTQDLVEATSNN